MHQNPEISVCLLFSLPCLILVSEGELGLECRENEIEMHKFNYFKFVKKLKPRIDFFFFFLHL